MRGSVTAPQVSEVPLWAPEEWSCLRCSAADFLSDAEWVTDVWLTAGVQVPDCWGNQCRSGAEKNLRIWVSSLLWRTDNTSSIPLYGKVFEELSHLCSRLSFGDTLCCYFGTAITGKVQNLVCCLWGGKSSWTLRPQHNLFLLGHSGKKPMWVQVMLRETWPGTLHVPTSALAPRQGNSAVLCSLETGLPHSWWGNAWVPCCRTTVPGKSSPDRSSVSAGHKPRGPGLASQPQRKLPMLWNEFFNQETKFPFL